MNTGSSVTYRTNSLPSVHVFRRIFSFPVMLASLLAMLAVVTVRARFNDPDMWWHLKTGEVIWTTHVIPTTDLFSYTTNHHMWIPHEWLSQLMIYGAYRWGGYSGLMLWLCCFTVLLLLAGYILCSLYSGNSKTAFLGALVIWLFSTTGLSVRPQLIGLLFLVLELILVHLGSTRDPRWFFVLPPLFAIWVNSHGSFFLGLLVLGVFLLCSFFDFRLGLLVSSRWDIRRRRMLALAVLLSIAALFLNPVGVKQVLYPLDTMFRQPINLSQIDEWKQLPWNGPRGIALLILLGCIFLLLICRLAELHWHELLLLSLGTWLAISHQRMVFVFGIVAAPVLSRLLSTSWDGYDVKRDHPWPNAALIAASALIAFFCFPTPNNIAKQISDGNPVKAVEFIKTHHLSGHMLNAYVYGGYLIWALPEQPVFFDGRADLYEWSGVLGEFIKWTTLQNNPNELLNKYGVTFCLLNVDSPMVRVLPLMAGWKVIYSDNVSVIVARSAP